MEGMGGGTDAESDGDTTGNTPGDDESESGDVGTQEASATGETESGDVTGGPSGVLSFELDGCIDVSAGMQLADYLDDPADVEGLTCSFTEGEGNGVMPDPVSLTDCEVSGTPEVYYSHPSWTPGDVLVRVGVWAFVILVEDGQGGERYVPICVSRGGETADIYSLTQRLADDSEVPLETPNLQTFVPGEPVGVSGAEGAEFVLSEARLPLNDIEHAGAVSAFSPAPLADPILLSTSQFYTDEAHYIVTFDEETPSPGEWERPFVSVVDIELCARGATSAGCDPKVADAHTVFALTHAVIFSP